MKTMTLPLWVGIAAVASLTRGYAEAPVMHDASTHEQLVLQLRKAEQNDPMKKMPPVTTPDPVKANPPKDLISDSDILCFNGYATLLPKRAVLFIPKNLEDHMKYQSGAKILGWLDFYARNRGWITTVEVSRAQAEGNQALEDDTTTLISKSSNLVVATYQTGPISVLPPKDPLDDKPGKSNSSKKPDSKITPTGSKKP